MSLPSFFAKILPGRKNALLAVVSAVLLILAFPDFEWWFLAWIGLVPLFWAIEREKARPARGLVLGWIWGVVFFTGTCWWLTFAPITYAGFPWPLAYFLLIIVASIAAIFPGVFGLILGVLVNRFGRVAILTAPFVWVFTEFLRYWIIGNNWNAIGYSQAWNEKFTSMSAYGGVELAGFVVIALNLSLGLVVFGTVGTYLAGARKLASNISKIRKNEPAEPFALDDEGDSRNIAGIARWLIVAVVGFNVASIVFSFIVPSQQQTDKPKLEDAQVIAIQPNVPMSGLTYEKWKGLRQKHVELAESALQKLPTANRQPPTVVFPESPMNFAWDEDPEFQAFLSTFAAKNNVSVLFNSAEPNEKDGKYFNSAVLVDPRGKEVAQYDKIYLLPFGESVPLPLQSIVPAFVGSFSFGSEYDLLPLGDAKAGVMICFESHFGELGRRYVSDGADVLIEMTNDGYLGPTPVLRQHLANAVFRAVETNRPVLRVTNVGITAYINERGEILDPAPAYSEDTRVWSVSKSDGSQTFYVKYGDWFAWLCSIVTLGLFALSLIRRRRKMSEPPG